MAEDASTDLLPGLFAPARLPWDSIMDSVRDGVLCLEQSGRVIYVNQALEGLFGIKRADVIGNALTFSKELNEVFANARCVISSNTAPLPHFHREIAFRSADGEERPISVTITFAAQGELRIQIAVIRDLSNLKRMEEALVQSRKGQAIGALAGGIAHDFNNILTALLSQLDLALDSPNLPSQARDHIVFAQTSGRRAAELISRLQTFSRQTEAHTTTLDLAELIDQVVLILRRSIDRRIEIKSEHASSGRWLIKGDASQVLQVILNICLNARDAMPEGGRLSIRLHRTRRSMPQNAGTSANQNWVQISIQDTGSGMTPEVERRLFEPYFTTKAPARGTGLGLSIAQSIIQDQGGWIEAESERDKGSTFHVFLPETALKAGPDTVEVIDIAGTETRALEGRESILIVDDEEMVRLVMKAVLSYRGYTITEACDGENMLEIVRTSRTPIDLVLLDVDMPRLNGWDALRHLKVELPGARVILLSGGAVESDVEKARACGADGFLAKPFKNDKLVQLVRTTLDEARAAGVQAGAARMPP